jgi:hypothetical protein
MTYPERGGQQPPFPQPYQGHGGQQLPGKPRRSYKGWLVASVILNVILLVAAASATSQQRPVAPSSSPQAAASTPAAKTSAPPSAAPARSPAPAPVAAVSRTRTIATFTGSGIENTPQFTIGGDGTWKLDWTYNCSSDGGSGNFIVGEDQDDFSGVNVNELGPGGHGSTWAYSDAGTHYLAINSECEWRVKVIGQP